MTAEIYDAFESDVPGEPARPLRERAAEYLPAVALFFGGLALWEAAVRGLGIAEILLPKPSVIATTFVDQFGEVWEAGFTTLKEALGGFAAGAVLGVALALLAARWVAVREGLLPFAIAANSAPIIALAPISNQWFGVTDPVSKMAVVMVIVFFPVMINTLRGLTEVDPAEIELLRSWAASEREVVRRVRIPNALPYLFSALKIGATLSVIGAIVAEYFGGPRNTLGVYITQNASLGRIPEAWSAVIIGIVMGVTFYLAILAAERLLMPWHVSFRQAEG